MENINYSPCVQHRICKLCLRPLKLIGVTRRNGKDINLIDWSTRKYHKRCYKKIV